MAVGLGGWGGGMEGKECCFCVCTSACPYFCVFISLFARVVCALLFTCA